MNPKYSKALRRFPAFAESTEVLLREQQDTFEQLTAQVTAPVLFSYVWFVLQKAQSMGLKRLYFLARDGYVLLRIAEEIVKAHKLPLELRYLYCSRAALRMPSYHRIAPEEAMDLLLHRGTNLTRRHILDRAQLTDAQRLAVYETLDYRECNEHTPLTEAAFADFCKALRGCDVFRECVHENSIAAYDAAIGYFRQEGLFDGTPFAIVDSGWTGSMQRSLRQLSDELPPMTGFYFGMFANPKSKEDGSYLTWYFSPSSSIRVLTKFNNNVFECMCAAAHGMTIGYRKEKEDRYAPVCKSNAASHAVTKKIETQIAVCTSFAHECAQRIRFSDFQEEKMHRISRSLLQGLMYRTSAEEAAAFGDFPFCDDVTESYTSTLVQYGAEGALREHLILHRIVRKLQGHKPSHELFWIYGTLAVSRLRMKPLRRISLRAWDVLRCMINKWKKL